MRGEEPLDSVFNLLLDEDCAVAMIMFTMAEADVRTVMRHPATMIGTDGIWSHGKPHPRIYGTYPRILGTYVREERLAVARRRRPQDDFLPGPEVWTVEEGACA